MQRVTPAISAGRGFQKLVSVVTMMAAVWLVFFVVGILTLAAWAVIIHYLGVS